MRWGGDEVGVVLTRNEVWLLLNALAGAKLPAVDWEGNALEPWVVGELRSRLQAALRPDPLSDLEERPIIRLDSDMGRSLAMAGVRPLVIEDGYDLGSLFAACAERGWGATLTLPVGGGVETPAQAKVTVGNRQWAKGNSDESQAVVRVPQAVDRGPQDGDGPRPTNDDSRDFVGLERPVVAFARALVGAAFSAQAADRGPRAVGRGPQADESDGLRPTNDGLRPTNDGPRPTNDGPRSFDEHMIFADAIAPGERDKTIQRMAMRGWELVGEEDGEMVFRRAKGKWQ